VGSLRHSVPAIYFLRLSDGRRLVGIYVGRILKGEKPADLLVQQSTKVELIINEPLARICDRLIPVVNIARRMDED
jgi:putative tryptophan/tyrosine transport system substrate-binding protein